MYKVGIMNHNIRVLGIMICFMDMASTRKIMVKLILEDGSMERCMVKDR